MAHTMREIPTTQKDASWHRREVFPDEYSFSQIFIIAQHDRLPTLEVYHQLYALESDKTALIRVLQMHVLQNKGVDGVEICKHLHSNITASLLIQSAQSFSCLSTSTSNLIDSLLLITPQPWPNC